jgi:hypothetical protein
MKVPTAPAPVPLVYILAASHSGSTLLAFLLGSHPELCTVGELKATRLEPVDTYRCSCDRLIVDCPFWQGVSRDMAARGFDFRITQAGTDVRVGAPPYLRRVLRPLTRPPALEALRDAVLAASPGWRPHLRRVQAVNAALARSVLARTGARGLVDSSKIGFRLKYLLRNPEFDVKVVRLVRDGRAAALTYVDPERFADSHRPERRGGGSGASRDDERLSLREGAREWRRSNEEAAAVLARMPRDRWMQIRYEDLARDPRGTLAPVFRFLGVSGEAAIETFKGREHHVVGNGMRFDTSSEIVLDERWRTTLGPDDLRTFDREAGALNRALGYV